MNQKKSKVPMIVTLCLIAAIYIAVFIMIAGGIINHFVKKRRK